ncbi:hypothetical protein HNR77_002529 [Paenibacillus sp. JGP012]|uniref:hypothetical protein n=1 Tax=Paenibacillus sp. JGP012 TaxID=2735914 RepID=UPI00160CAC3F|nr:hypothetical protein [Paenibacillus sp. JGP012]MBB6021434.1 hypothetical protein [Paenibacillus sp. JGP012]
MPIDELKKWIVEQEVEKRTLEGFWLNLDNYQREDSDEFNHFFKNFSEDKLDVKITQIALMLGDYPECNHNHVISYVPIIYNGTRIGLYRLLFTLDGKIDDDYFTIE